VQVSVVLLGCVLLVGAGSLAVGDYSKYPPESASAVRLSSAYLLDDARAAEDVRLHLDKIGYAGAAKVFYPAVGRDPASSSRWIDAGEALLATGHRDQAEFCYLRAATLAPADPVTLLAIGDYYSNAGNSPHALQYFSRILSLSHGDADAILVRNVLGYYEHLRVRELNLLDQAIPNAHTATLYLAYLMTGTDPAVVRNLWHWMHAKRFDDDSEAAEYTRYMFGKRQYAAAAEDWASHYASRNGGHAGTSGVFNGGFEFPLTGTDLDWLDSGSKGIRAARDSSFHHDGQYSMRIDFTANDNPDFHSFGEVVSVNPGRYRLDAFLRTDKITSAEGVRIRVQPWPGATVLAESDALTGTNNWTPVSISFDVPAGTSMASILLARRRALRIDNQLTGTVWLDSVSLTRIH
jgi:tetratricopeptide (TPR) repeat protein